MKRKGQQERFCHGFMLDLLAELQDWYVVTSDRESGFGRYGIMLEPKEKGLCIFLIGFKVVNAKRGETLEAVNEMIKLRFRKKVLTFSCSVL